MCEILGFSSCNDFYANEYLRAFYSHSDNHPHGWGLACVSPCGAMIEKESIQASKSHYLRERLSTPVNERLLLAHIRYATIGNVARQNCHPFSGFDNLKRQWTLIHNGTIFDFKPLEGYIKKQVGDTDSERIFLYMLDRINLAQSKKKAKLSFEESFRIIDCVVRNMSKGNKLNIILTDGSYLYAHTNCKNTLHILRKHNTAIFSTQPLSRENWQPAPFMKLVAFKGGKLVAEGTAHGNEYIENKEQLRMLYRIFSNL